MSSTVGRDVLDIGDGPVVLALHGGMSTWHSMRALLLELGEHCRVIAPTLPGSAKGPRLRWSRPAPHVEMADWAETCLDDRKVSIPVTVIASSYGALVAMELARRGRAARVVAVAPPFAYSPTTSLRNNVPLLLGKALLRVVPPLRGAVHRQIATAPHVTDDDAARTVESIRTFPLLGAMAHGGVVGPRPDLAGIDCPVTLVRGTADRWLCPKRDIRRWLDLLPDTELVELPGLPHQPYQHAPHAVAELVVEG